MLMDSFVYKKPGSRLLDLVQLVSVGIPMGSWKADAHTFHYESQLLTLIECPGSLGWLICEPGIPFDLWLESLTRSR